MKSSRLCKQSNTTREKEREREEKEEEKKGDLRQFINMFLMPNIGSNKSRLHEMIIRVNNLAFY